jgi:hypothetical protein
LPFTAIPTVAINYTLYSRQLSKTKAEKAKKKLKEAKVVEEEERETAFSTLEVTIRLVSGHCFVLLCRLVGKCSG